MEDSEWGKKVQSGLRSFRIGLEDSESGEKIESGVGRFRVGLEDSEWGKKIQSGLRRFRMGLEDSMAQLTCFEDTSSYFLNFPMIQISVI